MWWTVFIPLAIAGKTLEELNNIKVQREIKGLGLKKDLLTTIEIIQGEDCFITVQEKVTNDWFVDVDEVPKTVNASFRSAIDVEKPKSLSLEHVFQVAVWTQGHEFKYTLPVHLRYNDCLETALYRTVEYPAPEIKAECGRTVYIAQFHTGLSADVPVGKKSDFGLVAIGTFAVVLTGAGLIGWSLFVYSKSKSKSD